MFVAQDTPEKRRQYGLEVEQTFPLSAAVGPEDVTEILRVLRDITGSTHITPDARSRTITMRDTPEKLALAAGLFHLLDQFAGEGQLLRRVTHGNRSAAGVGSDVR